MRNLGTWTRWAVAGLMAGMLGIGADVQQVLAAPGDPLDDFSYNFVARQVTSTASGDSDHVTVSGQGNELAFVSTGDAVPGENADGNAEIFTGTVGQAGLTQATQTAFGRVNANPRLSGDGSTLLFQSDADLVAGMNANLNPETFRRDPSGALRQLTNDQPFNPQALLGPAPTFRLSNASTTDDGFIVVYSSTIDCTGAPTNPEIFLYDTLTDKCFQVSNTSDGANLHPQIDAFGTVLAFVTSSTSGEFDSQPGSDLSNPDGNYEVMEVRVEQIFNDPCVIDPASCDPCAVPGACHPCEIDDTSQACIDACALDPSNPFCPYVNQPPTITVNPASPVTVEEGKRIQLTIAVTEPDFDLVTLSVKQANGNPISGLGAATFAIDTSTCDPLLDDCTCNPTTTTCYYSGGVNATFSWTPAFGKGGADYPIVFEAEDLGSPVGTASQPVLITVTRFVQPNRAPTIAVVPRLPTATETLKATSTPRTYAITGTDADCDTLTLQALSLPNNATISSATTTACGPGVPTSKITATVTWTPSTPTPAGQDETLSIEVADPAGLKATATGKFIVVSNRPPIMTLAPISLPEGSSLKVPVKGTDPDGDVLSYDIDLSDPLKQIPAGGVWKPYESEFHWLPWFGAAVDGNPTVYTLRFRASDCPGGPAGGPGANCDVVTSDVAITVTYYDPNKAIFTTPSSSVFVSPGGTANFTLTAKNTGTSTWTAASGIAFAPKTVTTGLTPPPAVPITQTVAPGQSVSVQATVIAPTRTGMYYVTWQLTDDGVPFGSPSGYTTLYVR